MKAHDAYELASTGSQRNASQRGGYIKSTSNRDATAIPAAKGMPLPATIGHSCDLWPGQDIHDCRYVRLNVKPMNAASKKNTERGKVWIP